MSWLALAVAPLVAGAATYAYSLADFTGVVPYSNPRLHVDHEQQEVYALHANEIRIFNDAGMELYRFVAGPDFALVIDLAVDRNGDLILLSMDRSGDSSSRKWFLTRCDYRGRPLGRIEPEGWPAPYDGLPFDRVFLAEEKMTLVSSGEMSVVETTLEGAFLRGWDLGTLLGIPQEERATVRIGDMSLDEEGNLLLTVPVLFRAFMVSPEGEVRGFGKGGQSPGLFGIVSGIASAEGRIYVADKLRHVVLAFDSELRFVEEFGRFGDRPGNLKGPSQLAASGQGKVYVSQRGRRGVSVFSVAGD